MNATELKKLVKIEDIISHYITIENNTKPNDNRCKCPFHDGDANPSFTINTLSDKQYYYCHGCKASGDVIGFVERIEDVKFQEAINIILRIAGIEVTIPELDLLKQVNEFYQKHLKRIDDVMVTRKWNKEIWGDWGYGYAPNESFALYETFGSQLETLQKLGLVNTKFEGTSNEIYPAYFNNRLIFPLENYLGVIGFAGRSLEPKPKIKYLNTIENDYFHRRRFLYGMNKAFKHTKETNISIVVEGLTDVSRMHQHEYRNTVASLGTGFTAEQATLIARHTEKIVFAFDGDSAGVTALDKAVQLALQAGLETYYILFPDGEDPDSFLLGGGIIDDLPIEEGMDLYTKNHLRDEAVKLIQNANKPESLTKLLEFYNIDLALIDKKEIKTFRQTGIANIGKFIQLGLFLDVNPEFKDRAADVTELEEIYRSKDFIYLLNTNNFYKGIKNPEMVFKSLMES